MRNMVLIAILLGAASLSCGDDDVGDNGSLVGGRCAVDRDCRGRCLTGGDYPGGYCSVSCIDDRDCPRGTLCIGKDNGVCLLSCELPDDCRGLGGGYKCDAKDRRGLGVKGLVCIGD